MYRYEYHKPVFVDSHCHLVDPSLLTVLPEILSRAKTEGVHGFIVPGVTRQEWGMIESVMQPEGGVYAAYGVHPLHSISFDEKAAAELFEYAKRGAVAIGEIGLDYTYVGIPRDIQMLAFREQLKIAVVLGLPVLLHCRRAFEDLITIVKEESNGLVGGVMHAFSGSVETAEQCLRLGLHISICGTVTYPNAVKPIRVANHIPLDRMLLETDAPDLSPEPYRGMVNEPSYIRRVAEKISEVKGVSVDRIAEVTTANAERLFCKIFKKN
ncbi:TatD family hydrolase [Geobacter sp. DSM 9736]|uniref:TatD family hydrolase n=1 Tax=Geobacter sp. DSM 9736 TaxID=1277350 RepID=UPI000B4FE3A1|nr:TatD family hydrolase [Geobacter sp. DSM 9736]SNB47620.1 TatD DNase family protein [Geobacter sp. DSM 9736]